MTKIVYSVSAGLIVMLYWKIEKIADNNFLKDMLFQRRLQATRTFHQTRQRTEGSKPIIVDIVGWIRVRATNPKQNTNANVPNDG